jgi:hypothetical protein
MVLKAIEGFANLAEAREIKAQINFRIGGGAIAELSANASMERGGPRQDAPANN